MGVMGDCNINDEPRLTLKEAIGDLLEPLGIPVSYGLSFGHIREDDNHSQWDQGQAECRQKQS